MSNLHPLFTPNPLFIANKKWVKRINWSCLDILFTLYLLFIALELPVEADLLLWVSSSAWISWYNSVNFLQHFTTFYNILQHFTTFYNILQHFTTFYYILLCTFYYILLHCETQPPASIWLSSSIFTVRCSLSRIGNTSSHLHYMMFQTIQTISEVSE